MSGATIDAWVLMIALGGAGVVAAIAGDALVPGARPESPLRGYRASKRQQALESSVLLRMIWPLAAALAWRARALPGRAWRATLRARLVRAGEPAGLDEHEFVGLHAAVALVAMAAAFTISRMQAFGYSLYIAFGLAALFLPRLRLSELAQQRLKAINRGLPPVLDLIVMAMAAGSDFTGAVAQVVARWSRKKDPLYEEIDRFLSDLRFGKTRREALEHLAERAPSEMVKTFVGSVVEAEQRGTPIVDILATQADVARTQRFQAAERAAGSAGVLVKLPLMLIVLACMLVILGGLIVRIARRQLF